MEYRASHTDAGSNNAELVMIIGVRPGERFIATPNEMLFFQPTGGPGRFVRRRRRRCFVHVLRRLARTFRVHW